MLKVQKNKCWGGSYTATPTHRFFNLSERHHHSFGLTLALSSEPLRVTSAANTAIGVFSLMRRTDPSPIATFAPLGWNA